MDPIAAADYHDIAQVTDVALSPDGGRAAYVETVPADADAYRATVWLVGTDGDDPRRFTVAEGVDAEPRFSPDGDRLAFTSTRGADDRRQLWVVPTDGGEAAAVTDVPGGVRGIEWAPDGERLVFVGETSADERETGTDLATPEGYERAEPDPRVVDRLVYRRGTDYIDGTRAHVYLVDLDGTVERLTDGERDHATPTWLDDGTVAYAASAGEDPDDSIAFDLVVHDLATNEAAVVGSTTAWEPALVAGPGGRLAYARTPPEGASMRSTDVCVLDPETGTEAVLTANLDRTVDAEAGLVWDDGAVYFLTPDEGAVVLRAAEAAAGTVGDVDEGGTGSEDAPAVELRHAGGHATAFDVVDGTAAVVESDWDHRGDVFLAAGDEVRRLTAVNADYLASHAVSEPEELRFESDGHEIQGWVLTPPEFDPEGTYPLAVEIHGGPHAMWSTAGTMWHEFQTLAARGYVVFWCNPRGSTGYGEAFAMAIERDWGTVTARDVLAGVDRVVEREYVDAADVHVAGGSFGGFMTGWLVGHTDRFRSAVAQRGVYDLASFYGSTDAFKLVEWDFGTVPWAEPGFLHEQSPVAHVEGVTTPTLVVHAERDFRVPVNNGELFYRLLKKNGVDTRLVRYPREGHELSRSGEPAHVVDRLERIVRWFDGYSAHREAPPALERGEADLSAADDGND